MSAAVALAGGLAVAAPAMASAAEPAADDLVASASQSVGAPTSGDTCQADGGALNGDTLCWFVTSETELLITSGSDGAKYFVRGVDNKKGNVIEVKAGQQVPLTLQAGESLWMQPAVFTWNTHKLEAYVVKAAPAPAPITCTSWQAPGCVSEVPIRLVIDNRTGRDLAITPDTSPTADPSHAEGSGFLSKAFDGASALTFGGSFTAAAGSETARALQLSVALNGSGTPVNPKDAAAYLTVGDPTDPTAAERLELTHSRKHYIHPVGDSTTGFRNVFALTSDVSLTAAGAGTVRASLQVDLGSGTWQQQWRLVIEDNAAVSSTASAPTVTRLTADYRAADEGVWDSLKTPTYRIDVPAVTKKWNGALPTRLTVEPTTVEALRAGVWENLGTLTPTSAASFEADSVTFGASSFFFRDTQGGSRQSPTSLTGNQFAIEAANDRGRVLSMPGGFGAGHAPHGSAGTAFDIIPGTKAGWIQLRKSGTGQCLNWYFDNASLELATCGSLQGVAAEWMDFQIVPIDNERFAIRAHGTAPWSGLTGDMYLTRHADGTTSLTPSRTADSEWAASSGAQVDTLRLRGGWLGDATVTGLLSTPAPDINLTGTSLSNLRLESWSGGSTGLSPVVPNGLDADTVEVAVDVNGTPAARTGTWGRLYDYVYFEDKYGALITGLDSTTGPSVTTVKPRQGDTVTSTASAGSFVYVSTRSKSTNQEVRPRLTVGNSRQSGAASVTVVAQAEGAYVDASNNLLGAGVGITCGSAYTPCAISPAGGALFRDAKGVVRMVREYQPLTSRTVKSEMFALRSAMFQPGILQQTENRVRAQTDYVGSWFGDEKSFGMELLLVSQAGEPAIGTAHITKR